MLPPPTVVGNRYSWRTRRASGHLAPKFRIWSSFSAWFRAQVRQVITAGLAGDYREISEAAFHTLFAGKMPSSVLLKVIEEHRWIWTWARLNAEAQKIGLSPDAVAEQLGLWPELKKQLTAEPTSFNFSQS